MVRTVSRFISYLLTSSLSDMYQNRNRNKRLERKSEQEISRLNGSLSRLNEIFLVLSSFPIIMRIETETRTLEWKSEQ